MSKIVKSGARSTEMRQRGHTTARNGTGSLIRTTHPHCTPPWPVSYTRQTIQCQPTCPHFLSHPTRRACANERIKNDSTFRASERNRIFHKVLGKGSIVIFAVMLIFREDVPDIGYQCAIPLELYKVEFIFSKLLLTRRQPSRVSMGSTNLPA